MLYYIAPRFSGQILPHVLLINLPVSMSSYLLSFLQGPKSRISCSSPCCFSAQIPEFSDWLLNVSIFDMTASKLCQFLLQKPTFTRKEAHTDFGRRGGKAQQKPPSFSPTNRKWVNGMPWTHGTMECQSSICSRKKKKKGKSWQRALAINLNKHNHK